VSSVGSFFSYLSKSIEFVNWVKYFKSLFISSLFSFGQVSCFSVFLIGFLSLSLSICSSVVLVSCWYAARVRTDWRGEGCWWGVLRRPTNNLPPTVSSHSSCVSTGHQNSYREWRYHMLLVYNYALLKMSIWCSKHVEESNILRINNSQCIKLVINV